MLKEGIGDDIYHTHFRNLSDGRWWSPDPLEYMFPDVTPYLSMGGNPISFVDFLGLKPENPPENADKGGMVVSDDEGTWNWNAKSQEWIEEKAVSDEAIVYGKREPATATNPSIDNKIPGELDKINDDVQQTNPFIYNMVLATPVAGPLQLSHEAFWRGDYFEYVFWAGVGAGEAIAIVGSFGYLYPTMATNASYRAATHLSRVAGKTAETAFDIAKAGGKHAGFFKNYVGRSPAEINKAINSLQAGNRGINVHLDKIANPSKYVQNWNTLNPAHQQNLIRGWNKEITNANEQIQILRGILGQ